MFSARIKGGGKHVKALCVWKRIAVCFLGKQTLYTFSRAFILENRLHFQQ